MKLKRTGYKTVFKMSSTSVSRRVPIILIPGSGGSRLLARSKKTSDEELAWVNSSAPIPAQIGRKASQYLWGRPSADGTFESFVAPYADVERVTGLNGCKRLVEHKVLDPILLTFRVGFYFRPLTQYLVKNFGYAENDTLFGFTYDWRQSPDLPAISHNLHSLIHFVRSKHPGKKVHVISHSMGGLVFKGYQQAHLDWSEHVSKYVSLGVPYDGVGGFNCSTHVLGYNMQMPMRLSVLRGVTSSGAYTCFANRPGSGHSKCTSRLFLKVYNSDTPQKSTMGSDAVETSDKAVSSQCNFTGDEDILTATGEALSVKQYDLSTAGQDVQENVLKYGYHIDLSPSAYGDEVPDVSYCILEYIKANKDKIAMKDAPGFAKLVLAAKPGAVSCYTDKVVITRTANGCRSQKYFIDQLTESDFGALQSTLRLQDLKVSLDEKECAWHWESFAAWQLYSKENCSFEVTADMVRPLSCDVDDNVVISGSNIHLNPDGSFAKFMKDINYGDNIVRYSTTKQAAVNLRELVDAVTICQEATNSIVLPTHLNMKNKRVSTKKVISNVKEIEAAKWKMGDDLFGTVESRLELNSINNKKITIHTSDLRAGPWARSSSDLSRASTGNLLSLLDNITKLGSLDRLLFGFSYESWKHASDFSTKEIIYPAYKSDDKTQFRHLNIAGYNVPTPMHAVFLKPVHAYQEIQGQAPSFVNVDGDGTVVLYSAIADETPNSFIEDRVLLPRIGHSDLVENDMVFRLIATFFEL